MTANQWSCGRQTHLAATQCAARRHSDFKRFIQQQARKAVYRPVVAILLAAARRTDGCRRGFSSVFPPAGPQHRQPRSGHSRQLLVLGRNVVRRADHQRCRLADPSQLATPASDHAGDHRGAAPCRPDCLVHWVPCATPSPPALITLAGAPARIRAAAAITRNIALHATATFRRQSAQILGTGMSLNYPRDFLMMPSTYQFGSRSGVAVILWIDKSEPLNSCSRSRRIPTVAFSTP